MSTPKRNTYPGTKKRGRSWFYYLNVDGKKIWRGSFATQRDASNARAQAIVDRQRGRHRDTSKVSVEQYLREVFLPAKEMSGVKATTLDSYEQKITIISKHLGSKRIQELKAVDIERMQKTLLDHGSSPRTVAYASTVLSMGLDHAVNVGNLIVENPAKRVKKPRSIEKRDHRILDRHEMEQLLKAVHDSEWEAFYRLALFTGARRGELLALRWSDVDFDRETVTIRSNIVQVRGKALETSPKNGRFRKVKLDSGTVLTLRRCRSRQAKQRLSLGAYWRGHDDFITTKADGSCLKPHSATQHWSRLSKRLGITHARLHDARHTHATLLLAAGEQLHVVADRLGHIDAMVTSTVYAHVMTEQADRAADTFASAVGIT